MAYTYILKLADNSYYTGSCDNLTIRFNNHQSGKVKYTKSRLPAKVVYKEFFQTVSEAREKELQIKRWKSREAIERLINKH